MDFDKLVPIRPGVLVHEPQRMEELVHGRHQAVVETSRVEEDVLLPTFHTQVAGAVCAVDYGDEVDGPGQCWHEGDAGNSVGDQVHRFPHLLPLVPAKKILRFALSM